MRDIPEGLHRGAGRITDDVRLGAAYPTSKIAILAMSTLVAQELAKDGIVVLTLDPGAPASETFMHTAERFGWDPTWATPLAVPAKTVAYLATCADPMAYSARYIDAVAFAQDKGLVPAS
jgi:NAD(P)-dependent dehydrogenase (short-subunit alcohol dehydrogenase family)